MAYTTIDDPSAYFTTTLYTGNAVDDRAITNSANAGNFQPDLLWYKERTSTSEHRAFDSSRGASERLEPNNTNVEATDTSNHKSFDSNGFTIGTSGSTNADGDTYVAWQWKCNAGTKTTVTASGDVQASTYQPNTTAGFSILTWTGTGENKQITHGLGKQADWIMVKNRDQADNWAVWSYARANQSASASFILNTDAASSATPNPFDGNLGTSSIFWINGGDHEVNADTEKYVAYAWTDIKGYSKFGIYTGNDNADGPFIYLGFKPAWIMIKKTDTTGNWIIKDNKIDPDNPATQVIYPNLANAENDAQTLDLLSNGFKHRSAEGDGNDANSYVYMAFAESPFVSSSGVPATAR